ncbi:MAG: DmsE family decaheme c-type cytochrome [Rhodospirillaceae bacterium]|nr:DmsE family decaheme c-type cytochrome [Rhodospirillaceae bacterium]
MSRWRRRWYWMAVRPILLPLPIETGARDPRKYMIRAWLLWMAVILGAAVNPALALAAESDPARVLGNANDADACLKCHDAPVVTSILHTPHMIKSDSRTKVAAEGCQSCHGDSTAHMARVAEGQTRPPPTVVFRGAHTSSVDARNQICSGCHQGGTATHWQGSQHASSEIACTSCHASHPARDVVLVKTAQATVCFTCHADRRADALKPSHHPVVEGRMACADCHNPHGSVGPHLLRGATVNETCLGCHDEKRGPFLWEHAPVAEDCSICHTPHGSVQASLLKQRPPYLCQNCHDSSLHNSQPFSGAGLSGGALPARQQVLRACLNCHSAVHGSNHPSGVRLSR